MSPKSPCFADGIRWDVSRTSETTQRRSIVVAAARSTAAAPIVVASPGRRSSALALLLQGDEPGRVRRPLPGDVGQRAGAAGARRAGRRQRVRPAGDDRQPAGVAGLDGRRQRLVEVDLLGVHVGRHVARQTLQ